MRRKALVGVVLLAATPLVAAPLRAQISPGPLASAHRELEGALRCTTCHSGGRNALSANCLRCHQEVAWLIRRGRGFHARQQGTSCASCHPDHAGESFSLIKWPDGGSERFDHALAGWPLAQSHATRPCADCHTAKFRVSQAATVSVRKSGTGWTGLEPACAACHDDPHRRALGVKCETCHDAGRWTRTPGFNHDRTAYPLTGKHADVACARCHLDRRLAIRVDTRGQPIPVYRPVSHGECSACHRDAHEGRLGTTCGNCHVTRGFSVIGAASFDHERTHYPLRGAHRRIACDRCHDFSGRQGRRRSPIAFTTCADCHRDPHAGAATLAGKVVDCAACHDLQAFSPATLTVGQHGASRYPLEGRHQQVRCAGCHRKATGADAISWGPAAVVIRPAYAHCRDCHTDDHGTQLATRPDRGECNSCHTVSGWRPSTFGLAAHSSLRLPLSGRHAQVECRACHGLTRTGLPPVTVSTAVLGPAQVLLRVPETTCTACHQDPHRNTSAVRCEGCHDARAYRPSTVDVATHARFAFALEGAHRAVPCGGCHRQMRPSPAGSQPSLVAAGRLAPLPFTAARECGGCHTGPHGAQFAGRPDRGRCEACHTPDAWRPAARFDHERAAAFSLKGGHAHVSCDRCHRAVPIGSGADRQWHGVPTRCERCHAA